MIHIKLTGRISLHHKTDDYLIVDIEKVSNQNLTELLNSKLMDNLNVIITDRNGNVIFNAKGELISKQLGKTSQFYVGEECLDDVLWGLVDNGKVVGINI